jgi:antitoxin Phd
LDLVHPAHDELTSHLTSQELLVKSWPVQEAKARFSEFLEACLREGPQLVTRRGKEAAVLVPATEWQRLAQSAKPTLRNCC